VLQKDCLKMPAKFGLLHASTRSTIDRPRAARPAELTSSFNVIFGVTLMRPYRLAAGKLCRIERRQGGVDVAEANRHRDSCVCILLDACGPFGGKRND
jgi:hypothetical protein